MAIENITGNENLEELQALLEAVEKRLSILDEKKSLTRPEIYAKVRSEYMAKIKEIQDMMLEKGADLENALNQAIVDQDTLGFRKQELKDILDEMELRLVIGEIDEETKARQTQEHEEEIAEIDSKLAALDLKIKNYQKLTASQPKPSMVREPPQPPPEPPKPIVAPRPAAAQPKPAVRPQPEPDVTQMDVPPQPHRLEPKPAHKPPPPERQPAPEPKAIPTQRPAFPQPKPAAPAPPPEPAPLPPTPADETNEIDELEKQFASLLGESLSEQPQMKPVEPAPAPLDEIAPAPAAAVPEAEEDSHEGELKCPKCGSFNRADNWYCEKCGNELISAQDLLGK